MILDEEQMSNDTTILQSLRRDDPRFPIVPNLQISRPYVSGSRHYATEPLWQQDTSTLQKHGILSNEHGRRMMTFRVFCVHPPAERILTEKDNGLLFL